jgi:hypothetical protein
MGVADGWQGIGPLQLVARPVFHGLKRPCSQAPDPQIRMNPILLILYVLRQSTAAVVVVVKRNGPCGTQDGLGTYLAHVALVSSSSQS